MFLQRALKYNDCFSGQICDQRKCLDIQLGLFGSQWVSVYGWSNVQGETKSELVLSESFSSRDMWLQRALKYKDCLSGQISDQRKYLDIQLGLFVSQWVPSYDWSNGQGETKREVALS